MKSQAKKYLGITKTMNCGLKATIIAYRNAKDIDVQFEDGTIREHKDTNSFKKGTIIPIQAKNKYMGQTRTMNCGMKATIIAYRGFFDIDVQFEDGTIREHRDIKAFKKGAIMPKPTGKKTYRIGQTRMMSCGMRATIIEYRGSKDIDIQFEDGTIRKHKAMSEFNNGKIAHTPFRLKDYRIGQTHTMSCGMKATIIAYRKSTDIDVQFEDGHIREHKAISEFNEGQIAHPTNILFDTYKLNKVAFVFHDKTYFYVTYAENDSEVSEVMCIDDMKQKLPELAQQNISKLNTLQ